MKPRLGILVTHPIQYFVPWYRALAEDGSLSVKVFYCAQLTPEQQGAGFGVAFNWDVPLLGGYDSAFLRNYGRGPTSGFLGCDTPGIAGLVNSGAYDVWLISGWQVKSYWQAMRACWKSKVPMLIRGDSHLLDPKPLHVRLAKRVILGRWIRRFSGYLTVGKLNEEYYRHYGAEPARFFPVRHFVDNEWFADHARQARHQRAELRTKWGIPQEAVAFLFSGKFIEKKRPLDHVRAVEQLGAGRSQAHLLMVGDGPLRSECEKYATARGLPVTMTGFLNQSQMPSAYVASDVLVLPSGREETWGLVVNEAMACGLPAIVSDRVGCGPDLVHPGKTGSLFPAGNVGALAQAMRKFVGSPALCQELGRQARELVKNCSVEQAVQGTVRAAACVTRSSA